MSGDWLLSSTLGRRKKDKEWTSPQGRKGVDPKVTEEKEMEEEEEDEDGDEPTIIRPIWTGQVYVSYLILDP